jgi:AraC-like DNA-binding protein
MAGHYVKAAGHHCRRDTVTEYQVAYCTGGEGVIRCRGTTARVEAGSVFTNIPGHPHEYRADADDPWTLLWVHFVGTAAPRYFRLLRCRPSEPAFDLGRNDRLTDLFKELLREVIRPEETHQIEAVAILHRILSAMISLRRTRPPRPVGGRARAVVDMKRVNRYIEAHLSDITLAGMAREARISVPHFGRLFKERTGYTPIQYVIHRRIAEAGQRLLQKPYRSVKEIANSIGCEDQHYFSRIFKKTTGLSPVRYRQRYG